MVTQGRALRTPTTPRAFCFSLSIMEFSSSVNALRGVFCKRLTVSCPGESQSRGAAGRKCDSGIVLVLEHCRKRPHVRLLHFSARPSWHPGVSAELDDLHSQSDADPKTQVRFHRRRALATPARSRLTDNSPQPLNPRCISKAAG